MDDERHTEEILAAHAEALLNQPGDRQLAEQLQQSMPPVRPSAAFVHSLGKELAHSAKHQVAVARRMRRGVLIGAATVGSLVSIASVVGAIIYVISRLRARPHAHAH
jgi:uncharacterized protein YaaW (UPF0174 family)